MKSIAGLKKETFLPVVIANEQGCITYVNEPFLALFQWKREEITGKPLTTIIPPNLHDAHNLGFSRFLMTEKPTLLNQPLQLMAVTKEGVQFNAEHTITAEKENGHWIFGAVIRPLTNFPK